MFFCLHIARFPLPCKGFNDFCFPCRSGACDSTESPFGAPARRPCAARPSLVSKGLEGLASKVPVAWIGPARGPAAEAPRSRRPRERTLVADSCPCGRRASSSPVTAGSGFDLRPAGAVAQRGQHGDQAQRGATPRLCLQHTAAARRYSPDEAVLGAGPGPSAGSFSLAR